MQRIVIPELLDTDAGTPREIEDSLADLRMINRYFGGVHSMARLLLEIAKQRQISNLSWLDVGGGAGDLATLTHQFLTARGIEVRPALLDRMPAHMSPVPSNSVHSPSAVNGRYPAIAGDALALPFRENSFDVVGCCLFLHHLEPDQIIEFVNQGLRVARHAVLINDLIRHPLHLALAYAGYALYRSRLTRHDSVASVRRAYTVQEIQSILGSTNAEQIEVHKFFPFRMGVIVWKKPSTT